MRVDQTIGLIYARIWHLSMTDSQPRHTPPSRNLKTFIRKLNRTRNSRICKSHSLRKVVYTKFRYFQNLTTKKIKIVFEVKFIFLNSYCLKIWTDFSIALFYFYRTYTIVWNYILSFSKFSKPKFWKRIFTLKTQILSLLSQFCRTYWQFWYATTTTTWG